MVSGPLLVDTHVHLYPGHDPARWLDGALANLANHSGNGQGWLLLTETSRDHAFRDLVGRSAVGRWHLDLSADAVTLRATRDDGSVLLITAGRQLRTAEGLEVHALGVDAEFEDGLPLRDAVERVRSSGALPVIPWGFGKWSGARARLLEAALADGTLSGVLLGDSALRPAGTPRPGLFASAERRGIHVIAGSDTLPLVADELAAGRYGSVVAADVDRVAPWPSLRAALAGLTGSPVTFGRRDGPIATLRRQVGLRLRPGSGLPHDTATPDIETSSDGYATRFAGPVGRFLLARQQAAIEYLLGHRGTGAASALDVGGGHGQLTGFLLGRDYDVSVQGSDPVCAKRPLAEAAAAGRKVHFACSNLRRLPFADRTFDLVVAIRLVAHVEDLENVLGEMARVTRGRLVLDFAPLFSVNLLEPLLFAVKRRLEGNTRPFFCHTAGHLCGILRAHGFNAFRTRRQFFLPMVVHRKLKRPELSARLEDVCERLGLTALLGAPVILMAEREPAGRAHG